MKKQDKQYSLLEKRFESNEEHAQFVLDMLDDYGIPPTHFTSQISQVVKDGIYKNDPVQPQDDKNLNQYVCPNLKNVSLKAKQIQLCDNFPCIRCIQHQSKVLSSYYLHGYHDEIKQILIKEKSNSNIKASYRTLLTLIVEHKDSQTIEFCLKNDIAMEYPSFLDYRLNCTKSNICIWLRAVQNDDMEMIKVFANHNIDFSKIGMWKHKNGINYNGNALHKAVQCGHIQMVEYFCKFQNIKQQINEPIQNSKGNKISIIYLCMVHEFNLVILAFLLDLDANFRNLDKKNNNALHLAAITSNIQAVRYLAEKLPIELIYEQNSDGQTPIDICEQKQFQKGAEFLHFKKVREQFQQDCVIQREKTLLKAQKAKQKKQAKKQSQKERKLQNILKNDVNFIDENSQGLEIDSISVFMNEEQCQDQIEEFDSSESNQESNSQKLTSEDLKKLDLQTDFSEKLTRQSENDQDSIIDPYNLLEESKSQFTGFTQSEFDDLDDINLECGSICTALTNQSFLSRLTVHSRAINQIYNSHWQERAIERGSLDCYDGNQKKVILSDLKKELEHGGANVRVSKHNPNKVCVTARETGLHFILIKKNVKERKKKQNREAIKWTSGDKQVYIPITVLAPGMKFE